MEQGLAVKQMAQGAEGLNSQTGHRCILHVAARDGIEHPRGNRQLQAILEFDDQTLRGLTP
jgi:hypothetical protein